ncbi:hypothetical protein YC2023_017153 [Brassica napus]
MTNNLISNTKVNPNLNQMQKVKVLMGRTREGRACRRIKVQMCPQMLVPRKISSRTEPYDDLKVVQVDDLLESHPGRRLTGKSSEISKV